MIVENDRCKARQHAEEIIKRHKKTLLLLATKTPPLLAEIDSLLAETKSGLQCDWSYPGVLLVSACGELGKMEIVLFKGSVR